MTIRARSIVSYVGIVLFILIIMFGYLSSSLSEKLSQQITSELRVQAALAGEFLLTTLPEELDYSSVDALVDQLGTASTVRLTFIGTDGTVWGDTERDGNRLRSMDNHANRPEIREAMSGGEGIEQRYSNTIETQMRYLALPVIRHGQFIGVCRVALPMGSVDTILGAVNRKLLIASIIAITVAVVLSLAMARTLIRPIRSLTEAAVQIAEGAFSSRVPVSSSGELGELARCFNQMAGRIHRQLNQLAQERDRVDRILANMVEGIVLLDEGSAITYANPAAISMLGLPADYHGRHLIEFSRNPELHELLGRVAQSTEAVSVELMLAELTDREAVVTVLALSGERLLTIHDVSQLRQLERVRRDFVANLSHELRTPLTSIQGYAETLLDGALHDANVNQRFVGMILSQTSQMSQLISDLLDLSRLESGDVPLNRERCTIAEFRGEVFSLFGATLAESQLELDWQVPENLPPVMVDRRLMTQVLINLIDNAIKYSQVGGKITVSAETGDGEIVVHLSDTGIGIPSDSIPRVFERFYRVDRGRSRQMGGTGLGLSIAKHVLRQHGGRIWVDSVLGEGATFHITLPF